MVRRGAIRTPFQLPRYKPLLPRYDLPDLQYRGGSCCIKSSPFRQTRRRVEARALNPKDGTLHSMQRKVDFALFDEHPDSPNKFTGVRHETE
jgi:hypothetical protein